MSHYTPKPYLAIVRCDQSASRNTVTVFPACSDLIAHERDFDIVILDQPAHKAEKSLESLRVNPRYQLTLIYCMQEMTEIIEHLSDGKLPTDLKMLAQQYQQFKDRMSLFNRGAPPEGFKWKILAWLWTREERTLYPMANAQIAQYYQYPIVDMMARAEKVNTFHWLNTMSSDGTLEPVGLIDRIRVCRKCSSSRINFIDVCPECTHMHIERKPSLHCYTCGHVGHQESFTKRGTLTCPHCLKRLRHIGSDYDRPMENYSCNACDAFFVDAHVEARCRDCGEVHTTDELSTINVKSYALKESGKLLCRYGDQYQSSLEPLRRGNFISRSHFNEMLEWQIQMSRRYPSFEFSILGLHLEGMSQYTSKVGIIKSNTLVERLIDRINIALRETDRGCRAGDDSLWIALPYTNSTGLDGFKNRLQGVIDLIKGDSTDMLKLSILDYCSTAEEKIEEDAQLLLSRLTNDLKS